MGPTYWQKTSPITIQAERQSKWRVSRTCRVVSSRWYTTWKTRSKGRALMVISSITNQWAQMHSLQTSTITFRARKRTSSIKSASSRTTRAKSGSSRCLLKGPSHQAEITRPSHTENQLDMRRIKIRLSINSKSNLVSQLAFQDHKNKTLPRTRIHRSGHPTVTTEFLLKRMSTRLSKNTTAIHQKRKGLKSKSMTTSKLQWECAHLQMGTEAKWTRHIQRLFNTKQMIEAQRAVQRWVVGSK